MTLALILFGSVLFVTQAPSLKAMAAIQSAPQSPSTDKPATTSPQDQGSVQSNAQSSAQPQNSASPAPGSGSPSNSTAAPSPATKPAAGQNQTSPSKPVHRKKTAPDCAPAPAAAGSSGSASTAKGTSGQTTDTNSSSANAPGNCPPPKVIVRQGGTKEPSIELIGGAAGDQQSQRDLANQQLRVADANLKKIADEPLSASQQDLVAQIRQFMLQSRSAVKAGEFERAGTLAKKAQQLSEELVKPATQ